MTRIDITLGLLTTIATIAVIAVIGIGEDHRMEEAARAFDVRSVERGAQMFDQYCASCHGDHGVGGMCPPLNEISGLHGGSLGESVAWRLEELGWDRNDPYGYVYSVIEGGRQVSTRPWKYFGNRVAPDITVMAMPAWGQDYAGPLRPDQIQDLSNFVVSFNDNMPDDVTDAIAFTDAVEGKVSVFDAPVANPRPDGSDSAELGEWLFADLACVTCHVYEGVSNPDPAAGPPLTGLASISEDRLAGDDYTGEATSVLEYIQESIIDPGAHVVATFSDGVMPQSFGSLDASDIDALIAFLMGDDGGAAADDADADEADADAGEDAVTEDETGDDDAEEESSDDG